MTCKLSGYARLNIDIGDVKEVTTCDPQCPYHDKCPIERLDLADGQSVNTFCDSDVTQKDINEFLDGRQKATCDFITDIMLVKGKQ